MEVLRCESKKRKIETQINIKRIILRWNLYKKSVLFLSELILQKIFNNKVTTVWRRDGDTVAPPPNKLRDTVSGQLLLTEKRLLQSHNNIERAN